MNIRLIPITAEMKALTEQSEQFRASYQAAATTKQLKYLSGVVAQSLQFYRRVRATEPWTGYLVALIDPALIVGCCGFKGNPDEAGAVEISYHTLPEYEGRGYATAIAAEMVETARRHDVDRILAHTLPERNASCRVLEKNGFQLVGTVEDAEDGSVWRWQRTAADQHHQ